MVAVKSTSTGTTSSSTSEIVVFWIIRDSVCAECGDELGKGRFLRMEAERPLCLACADLDHLVFLSRGDAALTRRASRYSTLRAVVVRFSRSRKGYERQGVLVEEAALTRAEQECLSDAEARQLARERTAERRQDLDAEYVEIVRAACRRPVSRVSEERNNGRSLNTRARSTRVESGAPLPPRSLRRVRSNWPFAHMCATRTRGMTNSCRAGALEPKLAVLLPDSSRSAWNNGSVGIVTRATCLGGLTTNWSRRR